MFSIGIGPSSSHTVGPMLAAKKFVEKIKEKGLSEKVERLHCDTYGSLAATGKGHGTDKALILGFLGKDPKTVNINTIESKLSEIKEKKQITLPWNKEINFDLKTDISFHRLEALPFHSNGMHFTALDKQEEILAEEIFYSIGGGFICTEKETKQKKKKTTENSQKIPFPFDSAEELLNHCQRENLSISEISLANENAVRPEKETLNQLNKIWEAMEECISNGIKKEGIMSGGLKIKRRAKEFHERILQREKKNQETDPLEQLDWVNLYALAVNEENATGGRVVTAPTNGAAGIIPAVLKYATRFRKSPLQNSVHSFLLTAGAIGSLYKKNASISGAEAGCQGEIGVACSMAAGGLTAYLGGTPQQVENAAEIGMEHNLGLTCDPVGGLVQIPCIERNAMGAVKAINATRMALAGDGSHFVSLDKVIKTMRDTGRDMKDKYKETSRGGLAVNVVEC